MKKLLLFLIGLMLYCSFGMSLPVYAEECLPTNEPACTMDAQQTKLNDKWGEWEEKADDWWDDHPKKDAIEKAMNDVRSDYEYFKDMPISGHVDSETSLPDGDWNNAHLKAKKAMSYVQQVYVNPLKPGNVPEGDLIENFIPQLIRQLFRFAYLAILISFLVSGAFLVMVLDNDERLTKAKQMIYFSFIGFAFITLAFAIVKAITDIDFFMTGF